MYNLMLDEVQVMVIYNRTSLVAGMSECSVRKIICKIWTGKFGTLTNSADPNKTPQNVASDQGLYSLHKFQDIKG